MSRVDLDFVVLLNDRCEQLRKSGIRVRTCRIYTDTRVCVLATRHDTQLKAHTQGILLIVKLTPNLRCQILAEQTTALPVFEDWKALEIFDCLKMAAANRFWNWLLFLYLLSILY